MCHGRPCVDSCCWIFGVGDEDGGEDGGGLEAQMPMGQSFVFFENLNCEEDGSHTVQFQ